MKTKTRSVTARAWKPRHVALLLVTDAPPRSADRHFYSTHAASSDGLFRGVVEALFGVTPEPADKAQWLGELKKSGVYLVEVKPDAADRGALAGHVPDLVRRCRRLHPRCVILIKPAVHAAALEPLRRAGIAVADVRIPAPTAAQKAPFRTQFRKALKACARAMEK